ncbi:MAG: hypothetical protein ACPG4X_21505 [Pikeienuella sp.]
MTPAAEYAYGQLMAQAAFAEGHRGRVPSSPKIEHLISTSAELRRDRVLKFRLAGHSVNEIAQKVRAKKCTIKHDLHVLRLRGLIPDTDTTKPQRSAEI